MSKLKPKAIEQMGKLLDLHLMFPYEEELFRESAKIQGKEVQVALLLDFMERTESSNFNRVLFHPQKIVFDTIKIKKWYREVDIDQVNQEIKSIQDKYPTYPTIFATKSNFNRHFLSIDITSANFTVLKEIGGEDVAATWKEFIQPFMHWSTPPVLLDSKHYRLLALSKLAKLPPLWHLTNLRLFEQLWEKGILVNREIIVVNKDEIVISIDSAEEGQAILDSFPLDSKFKARIFKLEPIDTSELPQVGNFKTTDYCLKRFLDGSFRLMNIHPPHYNSVLLQLQSKVKPEN